MAPAATPTNRLRELVYADAFWAMTASVLAVVTFASSAAIVSRSDARCSLLERSARTCDAESRDLILPITFDSSCPVARILRRKRSSSAGGTKPRMSADVEDGMGVTASETAASMAGPRGSGQAARTLQ